MAGIILEIGVVSLEGIPTLSLLIQKFGLTIACFTRMGGKWKIVRDILINLNGIIHVAGGLLRFRFTEEGVTFGNLLFGLPDEHRTGLLVTALTQQQGWER